jgi:peroxiredoxin
MSKCLRVFAALLAVLLLAGCGGAEQNSPAVTLPAGITGKVALGDIMPELSLATEEGKEYKLSQLLQEKKLVVLNFWFADCPWCVREFPEMELVYQRHRQDVEIVALNPVDDLQTIASFREQHSLSFPMISCPRAWSVECGVSAYPTSIFIDRDGVVCLIHVGAITQADDFRAVFEVFTGDDYSTRIYRNIRQILN